MAQLPVDRGWAWLVLIGCFINTFFVIGGMKSIGIMLVQVVEYFDASPAVAGWMIGLQYFGLSVVSPISTVLGERFSYRCVVFIGGTVMACGFFLAALIRNVYVVITVLGLFIGVGNGFLFTPSLVMVNKYFDRYRSTAMGFVMAGGSVGQLVIPVLLQYLLDELSFYGCCLIYSAITLNTAVGAMLLRPPSFYSPRRRPLQQHTADVKPTLLDTEKYRTQEENGTIPSHNSLENVSESANKTKMAAAEDVNRRGNSLTKTGEQDENDCMLAVTQNEHKKSKDGGVGGMKDEHTHSLCHPFVMMFDRVVTGKYVFWLYDAAVCLANAGYLCQFFMLPSYGKEINISKQDVAWILSISGLVDLVARVVGGVFDNLRVVGTGVIISISLFIAGIAISACLFFPGFGSLLAHSIILGFFGGMYISLYPVALVEFMGLDLFPKAFSLIVMSMGFVILPLPNIFGEIFDLVGSYLPTMWICIVAMVIGGILVTFEPLAKKMDDKRLATNNNRIRREQNDNNEVA